MQRTKRIFRGFTLIEMVVAISILAILALVAWNSFRGSNEQAQDGKKIADLTAIRGSLEMYRSRNGKYPLPRNGTSSFTTLGNAVVPLNVSYNGSAITGGVSYGKFNNAIIGVIDEEVLGSEYLSPFPRDPYFSNISGSATYGPDRYLYAVDCGSPWDGQVITCKAASYQLAVVLNNKGNPKLFIAGNTDLLFGAGYQHGALASVKPLFKGNPKKLEGIE